VFHKAGIWNNLVVFGFKVRSAVPSWSPAATTLDLESEFRWQAGDRQSLGVSTAHLRRTMLPPSASIARHLHRGAVRIHRNDAAQVNGSILGTATDSSKAAVPGVAVRVVNVDTNLSQAKRDADWDWDSRPYREAASRRRNCRFAAAIMSACACRWDRALTSAPWLSSILVCPFRTVRRTPATPWPTRVPLLSRGRTQADRKRPH
jgi:hypothetical protein